MRASIAAMITLAILFTTSVGLRPASGGDGVDPAYKAEIEKWKAHRYKRLTDEEGYLSLTGLFWIGEGRNTFGSDPGNDLVFTGSGIPPRIGTYELKDGVITVSIEPGVGVKAGDEPFAGGRVYHDNDDEAPVTVLQLGRISWWAIHRGDRYGVRVSDPQSPTLAEFKASKGLTRFPTSEDWRIEARLETYDPPRFIEFVDVNGIKSRELAAGAIVFEWEGKEYRLDGVPYKDEYFIIFGDATNGHETYGGGRFLYMDAADENGQCVIDFNKAYTPWCAFSNFTTCQFPPEQNRLPIKVTAGEKDYKRPTHEARQ
jgi:uncharacterized protein (DUF1684 family)